MPGKTVLVIDTDIDTEQQIMSTLEAADYLVFAASTDDVLTENALKVSPSLLFFSAPASGARGLETCRLIHENKAFRGIPIVALTPFDDQMDPQYADLYGLVDIIRVPFDSADLLRRTEAALTGPSPSAATHGKTVSAAAAPEAQAAPEPAPPARPAPPSRARGKAAPPVVEDIQLNDVFGSVGRQSPPAYTPPPPPKKNRTVVILVSVVLVLLVLGGAAAYFLDDLKNLIFPPAKKAVAVRPAQPVPSAPPAQPAPAPQPAAGQKPQQSPAAPAAKPSAAPATPAKAGFSVQLGAFKDSAHAEAMAAKFKAKGYDAFVRKVDARGKGTIYKVLVGTYADRKESQKMADSLRAKEKVQAVIYSD